MCWEEDPFLLKPYPLTRPAFLHPPHPTVRSICMAALQSTVGGQSGPAIDFTMKSFSKTLLSSSPIPTSSDPSHTPLAPDQTMAGLHKGLPSIAFITLTWTHSPSSSPGLLSLSFLVVIIKRIQNLTAPLWKICTNTFLQWISSNRFLFDSLIIVMQSSTFAAKRISSGYILAVCGILDRSP